VQEVDSLLARNADEPIAHSLWREAWWQRFDAQVSAYVIGVAAGEIGFKQVVGGLVPDAAWLVSELPSPPLDKMRKRYLPILPVKLTFAGRVVVPSHLQRAVTKGIERRNQLVHRDPVPPRFEEVEDLLISIYDLLWLLDYYSGHSWAIDHLSDTTRVALSLAPLGSRNLAPAQGQTRGDHPGLKRTWRLRWLPV
jgi:hypothetical protein